MKNKIIYLFFILFSFEYSAQNDTITLNVEEVLALVRQHHPAVKQADIAVKKSDADIMIARGAFNPIVGASLAHKTFGDVTYYESVAPSVTIPTWFGIEVSAGLENLSGNRLNASETVGQTGYIGVNVPLLKNLLIDKRRAYLQQSKLYRDMSVNEQKAVINTILMDAAAQFWLWVNAYRVHQVLSENLELSRQRFEMIKKTFKNGERPAIDTLEAMTQLQTLEFQRNEAWLSFQKERLELSVFLWQANGSPYLLPEKVMPHNGWDNETNIQNFNLNLDELLKKAQQFNPELKLYNQKISSLSIDQKLKFQELLPKLDFKYNHLSKGYNPLATDGFLFQNNFQYGLKLEMPLLFSQGRGEYKKAKLKIEETEWAQNQKSIQIAAKIKYYHNEFLTLKSQVSLQRAILTNFEKLLKAEVALFKNGEGSLFLINSRENKVLEAERKLIEVKTKYHKTIYSLQWATGLLQ